MQSTIEKTCTARYIRVNVILTNWMMTSVTKRIRGIHVAGTRAIQEVILHMANWSLSHHVLLGWKRVYDRVPGYMIPTKATTDQITSF